MKYLATLLHKKNSRYHPLSHILCLFMKTFLTVKASIIVLQTSSGDHLAVLSSFYLYLQKLTKQLFYFPSTP